MNELDVGDKASQWRRMKALVLDSMSSPITERVYNMALDEFFGWYAQEPRPGFNQGACERGANIPGGAQAGSSSIIVRMSAISQVGGGGDRQRSVGA
jgi:hypothetical protein